MVIEPPHNFWHAGDLSARLASGDPRRQDYAIGELDIDLRACDFIRPPAVLWCAVYLLLAKLRGTDCRLLVPENRGTATYLKSVGLYEILQQVDIEVDDRGILDQRDPKVVLPIRRIQNSVDVDTLANDTLLQLSNSGIGSPSVRPLVSDVFSEIAMNAVQHAESNIDAYGLIQYYESDRGNGFFCAVSDGGIGVRSSLERNPMLRRQVAYDWTALELASKERITGLPDQTRGLGLWWLSEEMHKPGGQLILHSGLGVLNIREGVAERAERTNLFPGTLAFASVPT